MEFKNIYTKNNNDPKYDKESLDEYLELFTKYKLKVTEAYALKMDTSSKFITELDGYQKQLAKPYLTDKDLSENLVKEAYDRTVNEVKAAHILIQNTEGTAVVRKGAVFGDEEKAYAQKIKKEIESGAITFEQAAVKYSQDPSAKTNKGELGFFGAFQMVFPFEEAAYTTPIGTISEPIKTRFGYHLIKVLEKRTNPGKLKVAHIYVKSPEKYSTDQKAEAKRKIDELYGKLTSGGDFAELAKNYSEDKSSSKKGGELEEFGSGRMLPEFEKAAFNLKKDDDYSKPVLTSYGWHIIKRIYHKGTPSFKEKKGELKAKIDRDPRSQKSQESFVAKLKTNYTFKDHFGKSLSSSTDLNFLTNNGGKTAFSYKPEKGLFKKKRKIKVQDFSNFLAANGNPKGEKKALYQQFISNHLLTFEESQLENKYPEYKALMQEYRDGILLFELTDDKVWKKAVIDTVGLESFFNQNQSRYRWEKRADVEIFKAVKRTHIDQAFVYLLDSNFTAAEVMKRVNKTSNLNLELESGKFEVRSKDILNASPLTEGISEPFKSEGKFVVIKNNAILKPSDKTLDETRGKVISDYQNHLEREWIETLKKKYQVKVDKKVLYSLGK